VVAILAIALVWAWVAHVASLGNSSTFDEPLHTAASIAAVHGELGVNPEHPPLWKYVAGWPHAGETWLDLSEGTRAALRSDPTVQWTWAINELYRTGRTDGEAAVRASRDAMLVFGGLLILVGAGLAWRLAGARAGVLAALLLALDPVVLGHGAIVSNDVAISLMILSSLWVAAEIRRGAHWGWAALLGGLVGAAVCTKFTGVVTVPIALGLLLLKRRPRVVAAIVFPVVAYGVVWGIYGFRFAPGADGGLIDTQASVNRVAYMRATDAGDTAVMPEENLPIRALKFIESHRLLPQPMTAGLILSYGVTRGGESYALGMHSHSGWWWYFPFALLVKTPLGLLVAWGLGIAWWVQRAGGGSRLAEGDVGGAGLRLAAPLLCATLVLLAVSMANPLNIGVRHVLPVIALLSTQSAAGLAQLRLRVRAGVVVLLAAETALGFPNFIPFFNLPSRWVGPEKLLADSNLDWGQDLGRLAAWRRQHPEGTLHLAYWGTADPAAYGLGYEAMPRTTLPPDWVGPAGAGYVAVSVSFVQGLRPGVASYYAELAKREKPIRVGASILVFPLR
jgi:hypothetical protein